jgi:hypothetical protein
VYRIRRIRKHRRSAGLDPTKDPFAVLLAKLSGLSAPPKARQAFQQFMHEKYDDSIASVVADKWEEERNKASAITERTKEPKAGFHAKVARDLFAELPADERKAFRDRAKQEAQEAKAAYITALNAPPAATPEARQRFVENTFNIRHLTPELCTGASGIYTNLWAQSCKAFTRTPDFTLLSSWGDLCLCREGS